MKRGSFIAPLLLILIGGVFLARNIWPEWPILETLFTWWPVVLIAWGVIRALEILVAHFGGNPLPQKGLSTGEWWLAILIVIMGAGVWSGQKLAQEGFGRFQVGGMEVFGESYDYPVEAKSLKAGKTPRVTIDIGRGSARVIGADTEEVKITARKTIRAMSRKAADEADKETPISATAMDETVVVRAEGDQTNNIRVSFDVEITVPKGASITCRGKNLDVDLSDINGRVDVDSDRSGVRVQNMGGKVVIDTRSSDLIKAIDLRGDLELKGRGRDIDLENISGQVTISGGYSGETTMRNIASPVRFESSVTEIRIGKIPGNLNQSLSVLTGEGLVGPVFVRAKNKDVHFTDVTGEVTVDVDRGDINLIQTRPQSSKVDARSRVGDIEVALPESSRFALDAETERGEVINDFGARLKEESKGRGGKLTAEAAGVPVVKLRTERGSLTVRKSLPLPPAPPAPPKSAGIEKPPVPPAPPRADNQ